MLSQGAQNSVPSPLSRPEKVLIPKLKYEALEISAVRGPFERKVLMHYMLLWAPLKARYFMHYSCKGGQRQLSRLPSLKHTTVYNPDK